MENNYNEWNPNGVPETARDDIDRAEPVNESEAGETQVLSEADRVEAENMAEAYHRQNDYQTYEAGENDVMDSTVTSEASGATDNASGSTAANPYQQYHNPYQSAYNSQSVYAAQNQSDATQSGYAQNQANGTQASGYGSQGRSYGPIEYNQQGSPYGQQNPYGAQNQSQGNVNQSYGAQQSASQTAAYGAQGSAGQSYGTQGNASRVYGTQGNTNQGYGTYGQTYGAQSQQSASGATAYGTQGQQSGPQGSPYDPRVNYQQANTSRKKPKKEKKKGGFGALIGKTVAVALVFGLVAGLVFSGVSYGVGSISGSNEASSNSSLTTNTVSTVSTSGEATDLVDVASIVDAVMPSIVAITNISTVTTSSMFGSYTYESYSLGSGIIIAQDDDYLYICTNNHVVSGAETLTVQFVDDSTVSAEITGTDAADDLAVIQVAIGSIESDTLSAITIAQVDDTGDLSVGEGTIAIGNSLGYGQSVTTGVISALGRTISVTDETTGETTVCTNLIQTDAAINSGNSGGALLNSSGAVIGINSAKYSDTGVEGMGYAIPMSDAWSIIQAIIAGEDIPQNAYLGISGQSVSSDVSSVYGVPEGVLVVEVLEGTAAEEAGIKSGDIITKFEGEAVTTMDELKTALAAYKEGDVVTITVARQSAGYEETDITVTLGASSSGD